MAKIKKIEGLNPSVCVPYTDETCRTIDEDAYRQHLRYLLKYDINGLVIGGHEGETPYMSREERKRVVQIAKEEAKGRVLVIGGVISDSTQGAIEQGLENKEWGADAVLFTPPSVAEWDPRTGGQVLVEHHAKFDKEVDIPIILFGSPSSGGPLAILPETFKAIAERVENVVALKCTSLWNTGAFGLCLRALKSVRDIGCLQAGSENLFGTLLVGGDGNLSGLANFLIEHDVGVFKAVRAGDYAGAKAIAERYEPVADAVNGTRIGLPRIYFHYRDKIGAWLMGLIPCPSMRLPQIPPPKQDIEILRQAMIKAGMPVVHEAKEIPLSDI